MWGSATTPWKSRHAPLKEPLEPLGSSKRPVWKLPCQPFANPNPTLVPHNSLAWETGETQQEPSQLSTSPVPAMSQRRGGHLHTFWEECQQLSLISRTTLLEIRVHSTPESTTVFPFVARAWSGGVFISVWGFTWRRAEG